MYFVEFDIKKILVVYTEPVFLPMGNVGFHLTAYDLWGGLVFEKLFYKKVKMPRKFWKLILLYYSVKKVK